MRRGRGCWRSQSAGLSSRRLLQASTPGPRSDHGAGQVRRCPRSARGCVRGCVRGWRSAGRGSGRMRCAGRWPPWRERPRVGRRRCSVEVSLCTVVTRSVRSFVLGWVSVHYLLLPCRLGSRFSGWSGAVPSGEAKGCAGVPPDGRQLSAHLQARPCPGGRAAICVPPSFIPSGGIPVSSTPPARLDAAELLQRAVESLRQGNRRVDVEIRAPLADWLEDAWQGEDEGVITLM